MKDFKIGDDVFDIRYGKGKVIEIADLDIYPIRCLFDSNMDGTQYYTHDGKDDDSDLNSILIHLDRAIELGFCKPEPYKFEAEVEWQETDTLVHPTGPKTSHPWGTLVGRKGKLTFVEDVE